jgi:hypothetical protein
VENDETDPDPVTEPDDSSSDLNEDEVDVDGDTDAEGVDDAEEGDDAEIAQAESVESSSVKVSKEKKLVQISPEDGSLAAAACSFLSAVAPTKVAYDRNENTASMRCAGAGNLVGVQFAALTSVDSTRSRVLEPRWRICRMPSFHSRVEHKIVATPT